MFTSIQTYKERYHFSVNFYSLFLLFTFIPDILHINSGPFKFIFWGIKMLLSIWVIAKTKNTFSRFNVQQMLYLLVFFIYAANIYVDVFISPLPILEHFTGVMDFIGFLIALILAFSFRYDPAYESQKSFNFFWVTLTIGLIMAYFMAIENLKLDVGNVRYDANSTVNTISYGQMGCALALISVYGITNNKKGGSRFLFFITFLIGLVSIAKAGSRSPVVVLVGVCAFYFMAKSGFIKGIMILGSMVLLFLIFYQPIMSLLNSMGSSIAIRIQSAIENKETSGRDVIWTNTLSIIQQSPIFGAYYIVPTGFGAGHYPHNFFLEVFLATGFVGGVPFVILTFTALVKSYRLIKMNHPCSWIIIMFLQIIVFGNFSTGLYSSQDYWILAFYICSIDMPRAAKTNKVAVNAYSSDLTPILE